MEPETKSDVVKLDFLTPDFRENSEICHSSVVREFVKTKNMVLEFVNRTAQEGPRCTMGKQINRLETSSDAVQPASQTSRLPAAPTLLDDMTG